MDRKLFCTFCLLLFSLTACGGDEVESAMRCPDVDVVSRLSEQLVYKPLNNRNPATLAYKSRLRVHSTQCYEENGQVVVNVSLSPRTHIGPKGPDAGQPRIFVAEFDAAQNLIQRKDYELGLDLSKPNTLDDDMLDFELTLPKDHHVLVGFLPPQ